MGRRTMGTGDGGDSSPPSSESSFREHDDVLLQTRARIWLEEVLGRRLDEDLHVSDLLQDGELLFDVSKVIWNLLLTKCSELRQVKGESEPFSSKKNSGIYEPYSNVDSFIKMCEAIGMRGIDLFSPSDVVEKRDTRKVYMCIRALSKKARSKQLNVPDFDMVISSVTMPTNMVGSIRRSLELSRSLVSSSSSNYSTKDSKFNRESPKQYGDCERDDDSCSEHSDEAESTSLPDGRSLDDAEVGMNSVLKKINKVKSTSESIIWQNRDEFKHRINEEEEALCTMEMVNPLSLLKIDSENLREEEEEEDDDDDNSLVGESSCINGESTYTATSLPFSDLMVPATDAINTVSDKEEEEETSRMFESQAYIDLYNPIKAQSKATHSTASLSSSCSTCHSFTIGFSEIESSSSYSREDDCKNQDCKTISEHKELTIEASAAANQRSRLLKFSRNQMFKTFFKGSAIVGVFLLLVQINKKGDGDTQKRTRYGRSQSKMKQQTSRRVMYSPAKIKYRY